MARVSVVIPALNEATNLACSLPLVSAQLGGEDEIVVVDNGSTDATAAVATSLRARVVVEPVRNRSRARNAGIAQARGDIVVFLDADCLPAPGWLERLLAPFEDPGIGCVAGEIVMLDPGTSLGQYLVAKGHLSQAVNFGHPFLPYAGTGNVAFRRAVIDAIGGFDVALPTGQDVDICWRMQLKTDYKIVRAADAVVHHSQHLSARALLRQKRRHGYGSVLLYRKYHSHRRGEVRVLKQTYWEYRSIGRRACAHALAMLAARLGLREAPPPDQGYQLLLEIGEKSGRIKGCLRHRVWFP